MSRQASKSHHENNNGSFMDNTNGTTNDTSQSGSSFVGKVRSTLSKWFATPARTSQQVVRPRSEMEADDSSNNDSDEDSEEYNQHQQATTVVLPPAKRLKTTITETITSASVNNNNVVRLSGLGSFTLRNPKRLVLNRRNNLDVIQTNQDSDDSGESTSGYSSMPRLTQANKQEATDHLQQEQEQAEANASTSAENPSNSTINLHNRSLFDTSHDRSLFNLESSSYGGNRCGVGGVSGRPTSLSTRRPAFSGANLTTAASNNIGSSGLLDRTLATRRIYNSPFYSGRTLYGGASNVTIGQHCFVNQSMVEKPPVIESKPSTDNGSTTTMLSSTARRILDTLESYTLDQTGASTAHIHKSSASNHRRQLKQDHLFRSTIGTKPYNRLSNSNNSRRLVDELHVPNIAQLLKMKERLQNQTVQVRQMIKESVATKTTTTPPSSGVGGKMRAKVTAQVRQHKHQAQRPDAEVEEERLSAIQLPITALPNFTDLHLPLPTNVATTTTATTISHKPMTLMTTSAATVAPSFSFTPPLSTLLPPPPPPNSSSSGNSTPTTTTSTKPLNKHDTDEGMFVFAKPLVLLDSGLNGSRLRNITAINNFKFSVPLNQKLVHRKQQLKGSATDNVDSKLRKQETSTVASVAARSSTPDQQQTTTTSTSSFGDMFKLLPSGGTQWECDVCLVRNPNTGLTCLACTSPKPQQKQQQLRTAATSSNNVGLAGTAFKLPPTNRWSCDVCLVTNANERAACAACETPRTAAAVTSGKGGGGGTWECPSCMVRNPVSSQKCVCCETLQPGVSVAVASGNVGCSLVTKYNFGITPAMATSSTTTPSRDAGAATSGFTFGIPTVNCSTAAAVVPSSSTIPATTKPVAGFTFGIPAVAVAATPAVATATRSYNGTVSSTTTLLNNQQQKQTLPNGMISSSNTAITIPTTTVAAAAPTVVVVAAAAAAASAAVAATTTTLLPNVIVDTNTVVGIKFGGTATTATTSQQSTSSSPFTFGRSAADVSSSTNRITTPAPTTTASNFGSVSSTAVAQSPFQFQPPKVIPPLTTIACAFGKPAAPAAAVVTNRPAEMAAVFNFGGSVPAPSNSVQVQSKGAPFMFGGNAAGGVTAIAAPAVAPPLFSFGGPTATATTANAAGFGFGGQATMTFGGSNNNSNMFGQPKMKNGGFDISIAKSTAAPPSAVGFNFLPSAAAAATSPPPNNRGGIFSFGPSAGANGAPPVAAAPTGAAPFTFGAVSSSSQSSHSDGSTKQQTVPPLSFGGITSSSSAGGTVLPPSIASPQHTNMFGAATAADHSGGGVGGQRRIIRKAVRRTNTQPR